jgi:rSAM/selenodomain-associated transferase 1
MHFPQARLLMMARAPVAGRAKTRLIPALGPAGAAQLQHYLIERQLRQILPAELAPFELWGSGPCDHPFFLDLAERETLLLQCQQGEGLGARLEFALATALRSAAYAIVFGADIPELDAGVLKAACRVMEGGADAVVVPAEDGGYTLLGVRRVAPQLFRDIDWGTEQVMRQTRERLRELNWRWQELPTLWDLDLPEDLQRLAALEGVPAPIQELARMGLA